MDEHQIEMVNDLKNENALVLDDDLPDWEADHESEDKCSDCGGDMVPHREGLQTVYECKNCGRTETEEA